MSNINPAKIIAALGPLLDGLPFVLVVASNEDDQHMAMEMISNLQVHGLEKLLTIGLEKAAVMAVNGITVGKVH